jgi:hypothetical protein
MRNSQGQERPWKDRFWGLKPTDFVHRVRGEGWNVGKESIQDGSEATVRLEPRGSHVPAANPHEHSHLSRSADPSNRPPKTRKAPPKRFHLAIPRTICVVCPPAFICGRLHDSPQGHRRRSRGMKQPSVSTAQAASSFRTPRRPVGHSCLVVAPRKSADPLLRTAGAARTRSAFTPPVAFARLSTKPSTCVALSASRSDSQ